MTCYDDRIAAALAGLRWGLCHPESVEESLVRLGSLSPIRGVLESLAAQACHLRQGVAECRGLRRLGQDDAPISLTCLRIAADVADDDREAITHPTWSGPLNDDRR
jgi:hypothetical protein